MEKFCFMNTQIEGLKLIQPFYSDDNRGYFTKCFERDLFLENGIDMNAYEELRSFSSKGVVRGLHFQREHSQDKLIQVLNGSAYDVVVDLRCNSQTFGKWQGFYLSSENRNMLYIPKGFAHGFLSLEDNTLFNYLCGEKYYPEYDGGIVWNDDTLNIEWPFEKVERVIVSEKDLKLQSFKEFKDNYKFL